MFTHRTLKIYGPKKIDPLGFDDIFSDFFEMKNPSLGRCISSDPEKDVFEIELPGVRREDVSVSRTEKGISVEWKDRREARNSVEIRPGYGGCDGVKAQLADGILTVTCSRSPRSSQKIPIE